MEAVSDLGTLLNLMHEASVRNNRTRLAWRGHANHEWALETTLHRLARQRNLNVQRWERTIVNEFQAEAHSRMANSPSVVNDPQKWLVLMRHHALPVRLLDWTWNPLIAAYFAACENPASDGMIWYLNTTRLNQSQGFNDGMISMQAKDERVRKLLLAPFEGESPELVLAMIGPHSTQRITLQQGLFTMHGIAKPLEEAVHDPKTLGCIRISAEGKLKIKNDLEFFGVSRRYIFPELDALAQDIAEAGRATQ